MGDGIEDGAAEARRQALQKEIQMVKRASGVAERKYYRRQFSLYVQNVNKAMRDNETGKVIRAVLQKSRATFTMDRLVRDNGEWETGIEAVQTEVTAFMDKWHYGEERHHRGIHSKDASWSVCTKTKPTSSARRNTQVCRRT